MGGFRFRVLKALGYVVSFVGTRPAAIISYSICLRLGVCNVMVPPRKSNILQLGNRPQVILGILVSLRLDGLIKGYWAFWATLFLARFL